MPSPACQARPGLPDVREIYFEVTDSVRDTRIKSVHETENALGCPFSYDESLQLVFMTPGILVSTCTVFGIKNTRFLASLVQKNIGI